MFEQKIRKISHFLNKMQTQDQQLCRCSRNTRPCPICLQVLADSRKEHKLQLAAEVAAAQDRLYKIIEARRAEEFNAMSVLEQLSCLERDTTTFPSAPPAERFLSLSSIMRKFMTLSLL